MKTSGKENQKSKNTDGEVVSPLPVSSRRLRKLFSIVLASTPSLFNITDCDEDGEIKFSVLLESVGISYTQFKEFRGEIFSNFFVDFLGELLLRENIDQFVEKMTDLDPECLNDLIQVYSHLRFGMRIYRDRLEFSFHISLLQKILTEGFKRQIER